MKERPILFSGQMVKAILDGKKTQTRRVIKNKLADSPCNVRWLTEEKDYPEVYGAGGVWLPLRCPFGKPGDRLWVRETWGLHDTEPKDGPEGAHVYFRATDGDRHELRYQLWRPSIFMPRWASRITLEVTDVRVERLQEITEEDARAEGFEVKLRSQDFDPALAGFYELWEKLNAERGKCKTCKGHGVVSAWAGSVSGNSLMQTAEDCPDCKGYETGYGWDANPWVWVVSFKRI